MSTPAIRELTSSTGTVYTTLRGGTITTTETRNAQGLLTNLKTTKESTLLHNMDFVFNGATGNLTSRTGMIAQTESFEYDNVDRLTAVKHGSTTTMGMAYKPNGNIDTKTGLGQYGYGSLPHAVASVENTSNLVSTNDQQISYTAFNKVSQVVEKVGADNFELNFKYGPDRQRWKTELLKNGAITKTTIFAGDYEAITEGGQTRQLYYIGGADGLAAVYVKQTGQTDKIYYPHADHLGSIVKLTDGSGAEVFKASYDAWGNRTVSNNTFAFHRGYTGHEHLAEFKLIDMNGRMYDPLLGRFLSPDPFVQMPGFSQNYNRYSYCLNNPLVYIDPSGELVWFVPVIIGAVVGAYAGASIQSGTAAFWDWKPDAWKGAIAGAIVGATLGYGVAGAIGASGGITGMTTSVTTAQGTFTAATKSAGLVSTMLNSGTINIAMNAFSGGGWDGAWKAGLVGLGAGAWTATGGFGMVKGFGSSNSFAQLGGKLGYQMIGTAGSSIGNNWAQGEDPLSKVTLGVGPINLTLGKDQKLLQWQNNLGNIATNALGLSNLAFGGKARFDWKNLSTIYTGGIMEKMGGSWGPYSVMGPDSWTYDNLQHEMHHIWQSRSLGDTYLLHYGLQGINGALLSRNIWGAILGKNYFETQAYGHYWFNP